MLVTGEIEMKKAQMLLLRKQLSSGKDGQSVFINETKGVPGRALGEERKEASGCLSQGGTVLNSPEVEECHACEGRKGTLGRGNSLCGIGEDLGGQGLASGAALPGMRGARAVRKQQERRLSLSPLLWASQSLTEQELSVQAS